jgi:hypothetical protein
LRGRAAHKFAKREESPAEARRLACYSEQCRRPAFDFSASERSIGPFTLRRAGRGCVRRRTETRGKEPDLKDETRLKRRLAGMLHARLPEAGLEEVADPRRNDRRVRWKMATLLRGAVAGIAAGARSCGETEELTSALSPSARRLLGVSRRVPDTTLRSVLTKVAPEELRRCVRRQTRAAQRRKALTAEGLPFGVVAVDGKHTAVTAWDEAHSQKQSEGAGGEAGAHGVVRTFTCTLVSTTAKPCIDAAPIPSATNEMGHFATVLEELCGAYLRSGLFKVVSADAGSCSEENGRLVVDKKLDYLFGLRGTQPTLLAEARSQLARRTPDTADAETVDIRKPFEVRRRLYLTWEMAGFEWAHLGTALRVETEKRVIETGEVVPQDEDDVNRYYVSSLAVDALSPALWLRLVRSHWGVENDCHCTWDKAFAEDDRPWIVASPQGAVVVMLLRRIAYNALALFRAVTQRSEEKRGTPWKSLLRRMRDMLVALRDEDLAGLRDREALLAFD